MEVFIDQPNEIFPDKPNEVFIDKPKEVFIGKPKEVFINKPKGVFVDELTRAFIDEPKTRSSFFQNLIKIQDYVQIVWYDSVNIAYDEDSAIFLKSHTSLNKNSLNTKLVCVCHIT